MEQRADRPWGQYNGKYLQYAETCHVAQKESHPKMKILKVEIFTRSTTNL
jgi:hypothetical protein